MLIHYILAPIFALTVVILCHEFGHFILAKWTGMQVDEFSVGMGPRIAKIKWHDTVYSLRAIPIGGFNRIAGMNDDNQGNPKSFSSKSVWARSAVVLAGASFNVLLAFFIFAGVIFVSGYSTVSSSPVIGNVISGMPAEQAGLQAGDRIISVNGNPVEAWTDVSRSTSDLGEGEAARVIVSRAGKSEEYDIMLQRSDDGRLLLGIAPSIEKHTASLSDAVSMASKYCINVLKMTGQGIYAMIGGSTEGIAGPIGIAKMSGAAASAGFGALLLFTAVLSLNIGLLNLLPIPILDGGLFVQILAESVIGHKVSQKIGYYIQTLGLSIILMIFIFALANDVSNF